MQAVDLYDAGIHFQSRQLDTRLDRTLDQPRRHRRTNDDAEVSASSHERVNNLDRARCVAEAVAGNIEDEGSTGVQRGFYDRSTIVLRSNQPRQPFVGFVKRAGNFERSMGAAGGACSAASASSSFGKPSSWSVNNSE